MIRILTVLGARPQFVKAGPVSRAIAARPGLEEVRVNTGQHYDANMSDVFFDELGIPPCHHALGIGSASHGAQTGRMMEALERVVIDESPDRVLVYGDTNSTLAGALVAAKLCIPLAHVEAGLRSFNRRMPEEINRVVTDHLADLLFVPTVRARENLSAEGIDAASIVMTGDVMQDAALYYGSLTNGRDALLGRLGVRPRDYVLVTIHRAENVDDPVRLRAILDALAAVSNDIACVFPVHPRTRARLDSLRARGLRSLHLIDPVGYLDMLVLERAARLIVTDSGGVQKEAYFQRVPCLTLRDETEWVELVEAGWNRLCPPTGPDAIAAAVRMRLEDPRPSGHDGLYGDGNASGRIALQLEERSTHN